MQMPSQDAVKHSLHSKSDLVLHTVDETDLAEMYRSPISVDTDNPSNLTKNQLKKYNRDLLTYRKYIEKIIRQSYEYRQYIGILKTRMDLTKCRFIPDADITDSNKIHLEMHHYPFTLFELVDYHLEFIKATEGEKATYNPFRVANDIMKMHYEGKIGLVPLSLTVHELVHSGELFIPLTDDFVFGNWRSGMSNLILSDDAKSNIETLELLTKKVEQTGDLNTDVLNKLQTRIVMKNETVPDEIRNYGATSNITA